MVKSINTMFLGGIMKVFSFIITLIICASLLSICVFAQEQTTPIEEIENITQASDSAQTFVSLCWDVLKSTQTIVTIVGVLLLGLYALIFEKELPKRWSLIIPACFLVVLFLVRLFLRTEFADVSITITTILILGTSFIVNIRLRDKQRIAVLDIAAPKSGAEKRTLKVIQRLLSKSHRSIECIQLYSFKTNLSEENYNYEICFLGGYSKQGVNINALFSSTIKIPKEYVESLSTIMETYSKLENDADGLNDAEQNALALLISNQINKLKDQLNEIKSAKDVTATDCYIARILLLYISIYATLQDHDTYIGLGRDSLELKNSEVETALFTFERTGILGSLLFKQIPYVFSYKRGGNKVGRFYYTFSGGNKKQYIVMVSMKNPNNENYIDYNMSRNITSIQNKLLEELNVDASELEKEDS